MPVVKVDMLAGRTQQQKNEIAEVFTRELARIAKCELADVQVVINEVGRKNWAVGGVFPDPSAYSDQR